MSLEVSSGREQDRIEVQSRKQAAGNQAAETAESSQPMISSLPGSDQNTSSKIYPQLMEGPSPRPSKINPNMKAGQGPPPYLNNQQHHVQHWNYAVHQDAQMRSRAKNKFNGWSILAALATAIVVALSLFLFYWK